MERERGTEGDKEGVEESEWRGRDIEDKRREGAEEVGNRGMYEEKEKMRDHKYKWVQ